MAEMAEDLPVRWFICSSSINDHLCIRLKGKPYFVFNRARLTPKNSHGIFSSPSVSFTLYPEPVIFLAQLFCSNGGKLNEDLPVV